MTATARYYFMQLCRVLGVIGCVFIGTAAGTFGRLYPYNWLNPGTDWVTHIQDVYHLFCVIMFVFVMAVFYKFYRG